MSARGFRGGVVLVILGALLATPGAAVAKKKKPKSPPVTVVRASSSTSTDNQQVIVTATCPAGKLAVGGGFDTPPAFGGSLLSDLNLVYESRRVGDNAWQVSAVREDTGSAGPDLPLNASVDCRSAKLSTKKTAKKTASAAKKKKKKLKITVVSSSAGTPATSGALAAATATCPAGRQALGGGFSSSPTPVLTGSVAFPIFWQSYRSSPSSWASAFTNSGLTARTVTSYAYCAAGLKVGEVSATASLAASGAATNSATATTPTCTKGRALLGGGFNNSPAATASALALPSSSRALGATWQMSAFNLSSFPGTLAAFGYCA